MKKAKDAPSLWERVRRLAELVEAVRAISPFLLLSVISLLLAACGSQPDSSAPTATSIPVTSTSLPPTTEIQTSIPFTETPPAPTQDPAIFGAIGVSEVGGFALESFANAIFTRTMDSLKTTGGIQEYQTLRGTVFPGSGGLLFEVTFNVRTTDPAWLADGGTPAADNWINEKCLRFDFVTTETDYQLRNRRLCN